MPSLTLTVDNTVLARLQAAYGAADAPSLKAAIINDIRTKVANYELKVVEDAENAKVTTVLNQKQANLAVAQVSAETGIVVT